MLFRLQNIEYTGLIRKIFRNKDLEGRNRYRIQQVAQGKYYLPGYYFKELKTGFGAASQTVSGDGHSSTLP